MVLKGRAKWVSKRQHGLLQYSQTMADAFVVVPGAIEGIQLT
jgi:hypothetical protein